MLYATPFRESFGCRGCSRYGADMPITLQCDQSPLTSAEVEQLWHEVRQLTGFNDDQVAIRCVDEAESQRLNSEYRDKDRPTNVLTFSYPNGEHDIAVCTNVVVREAGELAVELRDYFALVVAHALLHVTGMDHEESEEAAEETRQAEQEVLENAGFARLNL